MALFELISQEHLLIGQAVKVELDMGKRQPPEFINGNLLSIDPTTDGIVIARFKDKYSKEPSFFDVIPSSAIKMISRQEEPDEFSRNFSSDFAEIFDDRCVVSDAKTDQQKFAARELETRQRQRGLIYVSYLRSHHIDVNELPNGVYIICGVIRLEPPYKRENFYCDIAVMLERVLTMISRMPNPPDDDD